jgi:hypothetical protein
VRAGGKTLAPRSWLPIRPNTVRWVITIFARFQHFSHEWHRRHGRHAVPYDHPRACIALSNDRGLLGETHETWSYAAGGLIHLLLAIAIVVVRFQVIQGRRLS